ncbi:protein jag [Pontibacillus halophilus JSM 076056 = DSM 19796]|uniref:RNA-binding protein KhpB n=1 Tax=Pontibacillus halophilus JSM 076056 = DSM 19796 TaxID=1385510 RepID=A0A0A5ICV5_9BACI|nr:RNA-binding cell elongation regulator Jag/EloR [Pontibacillus halophilus]KGX93677.1 protein jag [Pontibacillus halophilus JSM 076056 = DSM 19796]
MRQVTASGVNVEAAVQSALDQLNISRDQAEIEVIDEGKKGLFGLFGSKRAIVKVQFNPSHSFETSKAPQDDSDANHVEVSETLEERTPTSIEPEVVEENRLEHSIDEAEQDLGEPEEASAADPVQETMDYLQEIANGMGADVEVEVRQKSRNVYFQLSGKRVAMLIGKRGKTLNALQSLAQLAINRHTDKFYTVYVDAEGYRERRKATLQSLAENTADKCIALQKDVSLEAMPSYERKIIHAALQRHPKVTTYSDGNEPNRYVVVRPKQ